MQQIPDQLIQMIIHDYEDRISQETGHVYNRFVGFISESKLSLPQTILVLELLLKDALDQARSQFLGG